MTTIDTHAGAAGESAVVSFFAGVADWAVTTDHKKIGRMYVGVGLLVLLTTAVLAAWLGVERAGADAGIDNDAVLQLFQGYRVGLVFGGIIPLTLGLAIAVTPLQLGARQIAFPRLALTGLYAWLGGLGLTLAALARNGGMGGGDGQAVDLFLAGVGLMVLGLLASAGCVATSVLTTRAPGMTLRRVPLFAWSTLIGSLGMLLAMPVVFGAIVYLFVDHRIGDQLNFGGAEGVRDWLGWAFSVPAVAVYALPAVGVAAEMIPVTFRHRQPLRGVTFAGIALVGVTALAATTQQFVHDVTFDTDGETFIKGAVPFLIFAGLPLLGLVIVMALGGLTAKSGLANGKPRITSAFVFSFLGLGMVFVGLAGNFLMGITDLDLYNPATNAMTSIEEGATLYVVYGALLAVVGGLTFWAPKLWGRTLPERKVLPLALLGVGGTVLASLPLYIAAFLGQTGGIPVNDAQVEGSFSTGYDDTAELWNTLSTIGHVMVALTILAFAGLLLKTVTSIGDAVDANPFDGHTIEWSTSSPAPADNYEYVPTVASPTPQFDMTYEGSLP